jgi:hypothetical protein
VCESEMSAWGCGLRQRRRRRIEDVNLGRKRERSAYGDEDVVVVGSSECVRWASF